MNRFYLLNLFFCFTVLAAGQRSLNLQQAEELLQKNNLQLLAEQFNITASQAEVIQAKIWEQPYITAEFNLINPQNHTRFDVGPAGQKAVAIQQLIYLGGKKKNEINYAKSNLALATLEFEQLMRNLKYQLHLTFYTIYFNQLKIKSLDAQIVIIDNLVKNYDLQANKGNVALREVVRLQSLVLNLKNERNEIYQDQLNSQNNLSLLTGITELATPQVNEAELLNKFQNKQLAKDSILSTALANNLDYLSTIKAIENQALYLKWQRSIARPDITTGISYDQRGGAFQNQVNFTLGVPLPLWNKNKGNIQLAEAQLQQTQINRDFKKLQVQQQAEMYFQLWQQQVNQYKNIDPTTVSNLDAVYNGMLSNFEKRNLTMLEFTDFMESYNQSTIQINELKKALIISGINLNYITNKENF
jgi:cobalt-zinc-cadmium efflux system outer membrane protein